jgi:hypothetical protein
LSNEQWAIHGLEVSPDALVVAFLGMPRVTEAGLPVHRTRTLTVPRGAGGALEAAIDDLMAELSEAVQVIEELVDDQHTLSLDEVDLARDDEDEDLGMGDTR